MADLSGLNLRPQAPVDWDTYEVGGGVGPVPPEGEYWGQAPQDFTFSATEEGALQVLIDPITLVNVEKHPQFEGYPVRFTRASNKLKTKKDGTARNASMMGDYLLSHGLLARPQTHEEYAQAVEMTAGRVFPFVLGNEAYCKDCDVTLRGQQIGKGEDGLPLTEVLCPKCGKTLRVNARVRWFVTPKA